MMDPTLSNFQPKEKNLSTQKLLFIRYMVMVMRTVSNKSSSKQKTSAPCKTITEVVAFPPHPPQPKQCCRHQGSTWEMHAFSLDRSRFLLYFTHRLPSCWGLSSLDWAGLFRDRKPSQTLKSAFVLHSNIVPISCTNFLDGFQIDLLSSNVCEPPFQHHCV